MDWERGEKNREGEKTTIINTLLKDIFLKRNIKMTTIQIISNNWFFKVKSVYKFTHTHGLSTQQFLIIMGIKIDIARSALPH